MRFTYPFLPYGSSGSLGSFLGLFAGGSEGPGAGGLSFGKGGRSRSGSRSGSTGTAGTAGAAGGAAGTAGTVGAAGGAAGTAGTAGAAGRAAAYLRAPVTLSGGFRDHSLISPGDVHQFLQDILSAMGLKLST